MRTPVVESVEKWTNHYKSMSEGKFPLEDMYILNQNGRGLGSTKKGKIIYKIKNPNKTVTSLPIISPVAQGINQAESMVKTKHIKRSTKKKANHFKKNTSRKQKKKTKRKTKRKPTIRKKTRKIKKDIF